MTIQQVFVFFFLQTVRIVQGQDQEQICSKVSKNLIPKNDVSIHKRCSNRQTWFPLNDPELIKYRKSSIAGVGVLAKVPIKKGTRIVEYKGERLLSKEEYQKKARYYNGQHVRSNYFFRSEYQKGYIDSTIVGNAARYINHSCDPNRSPELKQNKIFIYSVKKIPTNAELTINYRLNKPGVKCNCRSANCRGYM